MIGLVRGSVNLIRLWFRRHYWQFHRARLRSLTEVPIDRPIFLLGLQGGGLTLLARMLRRNPVVVSPTGNHAYWAGPDEMQNVMAPILPGDLSGLRAHVPFHASYPQRDWLYATDDLLKLYRRTARDATAASRSQLTYAIRLALKVHALDLHRARFLDKSQTFTVRLSLVDELLAEHEPHFVLVTRNPYALCFRSALRVKSLARLNVTRARRVELAAEQWANSIACALEDAGQVSHFHTLRFEDLVTKPEQVLRTLCGFLDLSFTEDMLPQAHHRLPAGSTGSTRGDGKWYPIRPHVNEPYLKQLDRDSAAIISKKCGDLALRFGYPFPSLSSAGSRHVARA